MAVGSSSLAPGGSQPNARPAEILVTCPLLCGHTEAGTPREWGGARSWAPWRGPPCPFLQLRLRRTLRVLAGSAETCEAGRARGALTSEGWEMNILVALGALKFFSKAARRSDFYQRQPPILSPPLLATWPTPKGTKLPARLPSWHDRAAGPCVPSAHGTIPGRDSAPESALRAGSHLGRTPPAASTAAEQRQPHLQPRCCGDAR